MAEIQGQCFCGKVKYQVSLPLKFLAHDHCSVCRRISGAAFVTWAGVKEPQFHLISGKENLSEFKSTPKASRQFCKTCGSHLFFQSERWPGEIHFTWATVTAPAGQVPKGHVFFSDKAEWIEIKDNLPRYGGKTGTEKID